MTEPQDLSRYVQPAQSDARRAAQWSNIRTHNPRPRLVRPWLWLPAAAALAAAALLYLRPVSQAPSVWDGSVMASAESPVELSLGEGSKVTLQPRSQVKMLRGTGDTVQLQLTRGGARFEVGEASGRPFSVVAGPVEATITGSAVVVAASRGAEGTFYSVQVETGFVSVRRDDQDAEPRRLTAGEQWRAVLREGEGPATDAPALVEQPAGEPQVRGPEPVASDGEQAQDLQDGRAVEAPPVRTRKKRAPALSATQLFEQATVARRAGRMREAARLYDQLVRRHPRDSRAALAAFEVGRIRMDSLGDPRRAVQSLRRALQLGRQQGFAEDALARLVLAHDAAGQQQACRKARKRYLARYPRGVHARSLEQRCGGVP